MKKFVLIALLAPFFLCAAPEGLVIQVYTGGRFGEQLQGYLQAKWLSFKEEVPLLYTPFSYSSLLALDRLEMRYAADLIPSAQEGWRQSIGISPPLPDQSRYSSYFYKKETNDSIFLVEVDWKNEAFRKIALEMIAPLQEIAVVRPPANTVNIAIHVREGGGFDRIEDLEAKKALAMKVPPLSFYVESVQKICSLFPQSPLYVHLFTDAKDPHPIASLLKRAIPPEQSVLFEYRKENNQHNANVLEDFFSLFQFDVLIRSQSQFSLIPSYLRDYAVVCSPAHFIVNEGEIEIDEISLEINQPLFERVSAK